MLVATERPESTALETPSTRPFASHRTQDSLSGRNGQCAAPRAALVVRLVTETNYRMPKMNAKMLFYHLYVVEHFNF